jgi:hypothetical protein
MAEMWQCSHRGKRRAGTAGATRNGNQANTIMGLFKADFYRFFALGFAGGALIVMGTLGLDLTPVIEGLVTPAQAAVTP